MVNYKLLMMFVGFTTEERKTFQSNKKAPEKQRLLIKRIEKSDYALAATLILIRPEKPLPSLTTTK